jgi:hypothetical protein
VCITGKQAQRPFPQAAENATKAPGELTHTDVWGPARNLTATGMRYFMTFVDDYTCYGVVKFLKGKGEAAENLKDYILWIERQKAYTLK